MIAVIGTVILSTSDFDIDSIRVDIRAILNSFMNMRGKLIFKIPNEIKIITTSRLSKKPPISMAKLPTQVFSLDHGSNVPLHRHRKGSLRQQFQSGMFSRTIE
jgi:hypothetical protein